MLNAANMQFAAAQYIMAIQQDGFTPFLPLPLQPVK